MKTFIHPETGGELIVHDEVQEAALLNEGFVEKKEDTKKK